ncbi:DUF3221 domain-containing protein [Pontibacter sp. KCTC 32443]|uniref:DUF3221 domain-containing protein n=1 Tax=Pontibacter TaxID=323449 RepID=UPI00164DCF95|nr:MULTISPECIES: DUF3221 domain-containing protein [Pontibacter]MBC5775332.1 DUF3221 domain-containing protein [Pontibacter sp. KCTC 32443]
MLTNCRGDEPKRMPDTVPDINGSITSLTETEAEGSKITAQLLVEAKEGSRATYPSASIKVDHNTLIENNEGKRIKAGLLQEGQEVEVWFDGPVRESMPVQATAKAIRVSLRP